MKWLLRLFKVKEKLKLGDKVTSVNNFYSKGVCVITMIESLLVKRLSTVG